ncbi:hypothetical protein GCM10028812_13790 [Ancylobacter sonchi]|uniref:response regulator n=1 Tax=Ancylobacter sonchi TaxID=1937790 RepID=UPI0028A6775D|nr:response regulator [Ancylobacter sonchi]
MRIHVLEDDGGVSDSLSFALNNLGYDVVFHKTAESFFSQSPPAAGDVVLVDLSLPGITGGQAVRWLQGLAHPPQVVVVTGQSQTVIDHQLRGLAPLRVVRKPLDFEALVAALPDA